jgi:hypothetical protein
MHAQPIPFKKYTNRDYTYSFDIPVYWEIMNKADEGGLICVPVTKTEKEKYKDCFEGIIFRMELFKTDLDSTLLSSGIYTKQGDGYSIRDRTGDSIQTKNLKGNNWIGI